MRHRKRIQAEIKTLEERMTPKLPSSKRVELKFTDPNLLKTHSLISVKHRHALHKERSLFMVETVKALDEDGEKYFVAMLEPITE